MKVAPEIRQKVEVGRARPLWRPFLPVGFFYPLRRLIVPGFIAAPAVHQGFQLSEFQIDPDVELLDIRTL